jgi:hypothetical protein
VGVEVARDVVLDRDGGRAMSPRSAVTVRRTGATAIAVILAGGLFAGCAAPGPLEPASTPTAEQATSGPSADPEISAATQRYIDAVNQGDLDALVDVFSADATIVDVTRRIEGADAIRAWADREVMGGTLRVDGVEEMAVGTQRLRVHWAPSGSAGWAADYTFTVVDDLVVLADLQYAD